MRSRLSEALLMIPIRLTFDFFKKILDIFKNCDTIVPYFKRRLSQKSSREVPYRELSVGARQQGRAYAKFI